MNRAELDLLVWLSQDHRPIMQIVALPTEELSAWIRAHGGRTRHVDTAFHLRARLSSRLRDQMATAANVVRLRR